MITKVPLYFAPINKLGNSAYRKLVIENGADFVFSEMIKVDELIEGDDFQIKKTTIDLDLQSRTVLQIIAENLDSIESGVRRVVEINPNLIEINYNMGCPQSTLCAKEMGGGIMKNPNKVFEVSKKLYDACLKYSIEPSIKIRIGISRDEINIIENIALIKKAGINKVYIHGRALGEGYNRAASYNEIKEVIKKFPDMKIIANGDVCDLKSYNEILTTNCDGVLIGRAALENPQIFDEIKKGFQSEKNSNGFDIRLRIELIIKFLEYVKKYDLPISYIKVNLAYLTKGILKGADFRLKINNINDIDEIIDFCKKY